MEPRIQYARTSDGLDIAHWLIGDGRPVVLLQNVLVSNVQYEWEIPRARAAYSSLAERATVVRFDFRNHGLSTRGVSPLSIDDYVEDLTAVLGGLDKGPVIMVSSAEACKVAVRFAAENPGMVDSIIMFSASVAATRQASQVPGLGLLGRLVDANWDLYCDLFAVVCVGLDDPKFTKNLAQLFRESVNPEDYRASSHALLDADVREDLPEVQAPVLILHGKGPWFDLDAARSIVSVVRDGRIAPIEQGSPDPWSHHIVEAIGELVSTQQEDPSTGAASGLQTILFTDVEGSTALTDRLGDARARNLLRGHERITREALAAHGGSEVKAMGDGFMASFSSATKALECAIAIQQAFAQHNESTEEPINVRIGLNAGEPIAEDDPGGRGDLFGTAVNMAARIAAKADGGEILASNVVRELVAGKEFLFSDRGDTELRGFEDIVRVYEVRWRE